MVPAQYDSSTITVRAADFTLKAKGRTLCFAGWTKVQRPSGKNEDMTLPMVSVGDKLELSDVEPKQHFTKPPARFTEAALVKELEKRGIGSRSTYASIILPFKIVVMFELINAVSMLKKWVKSYLTVWMIASQIYGLRFYCSHGRQS